ncbi:MAG: hypothetical protein AB7G06_02230 [Bdellovibrionales bacterium]
MTDNTTPTVPATAEVAAKPPENRIGTVGALRFFSNAPVIPLGLRLDEPFLALGGAIATASCFLAMGSKNPKLSPDKADTIQRRAFTLGAAGAVCYALTGATNPEEFWMMGAAGVIAIPANMAAAQKKPNWVTFGLKPFTASAIYSIPMSTLVAWQTHKIGEQLQAGAATPFDFAMACIAATASATITALIWRSNPLSSKEKPQTPKAP